MSTAENNIVHDNMNKQTFSTMFLNTIYVLYSTQYRLSIDYKNNLIL